MSRTSIQVALGRHISHLRDGCAHHRRPPALRRPPRFLPRRAGARTRRARQGHNHHADSSPCPAHYRTPQGNPTFGEILSEVTDLAGGAVVMLLPLLLLAVPGIVLFVVLPALVLLAVATALAVVAGAIFAPIYLLTRSVRRLLGARHDARIDNRSASHPSESRRARLSPAVPRQR